MMLLDIQYDVSDTDNETDKFRQKKKIIKKTYVAWQNCRIDIATKPTFRALAQRQVI